MAALRTRISTLVIIFVVAALAATVGYQFAQGTGVNQQFPGSARIELLDRNPNDPKGPPPACYKHPEKLFNNPNCPQYTGDKPHL